MHKSTHTSGGVRGFLAVCALGVLPFHGCYAGDELVDSGMDAGINTDLSTGSETGIATEHDSETASAVDVDGSIDSSSTDTSDVPTDSNSADDTNTGDSTDVGTGDCTDTGTGDSTDTGTGDSTDTGTGDSTDTGTGDSTDTGTGVNTDTGTGDSTDTGTDDSTDTGTGDSTDTGTGDSTDTGTGVNTDTGTGVNTDTGTGDDTDTGTGEGNGTDTGSGSDTDTCLDTDTEKNPPCSWNIKKAQSFSVGKWPRSMAAGDFNGDGIFDLVVANGDSKNVSVLLGGGEVGVPNGSFKRVVDCDAGKGPWSVATGDFNNDGAYDLAVANYFSATVSVFLGNPNGDASKKMRADESGVFDAHVEYDVGGNPSFVTTGDFNGDEILDLAVANSWSKSVSILIGSGVRGVGNGAFKDAIEYSTGFWSSCVTTGDFDGDGILDLVVANEWDDDFSVLMGSGHGGVGDGTFSVLGAVPVAGQPRSLVAGHFNEDSVLDLAVACVSPDSVSVLIGSESGGVADGTFYSYVQYEGGYGPSFVTAADLNGDGILDLLLANASSLSVSAFLGNGQAGEGDGTFRKHIDFPMAGGPSSIITGDFNDDGIIDVAVAQALANRVEVFFGRCR